MYADPRAFALGGRTELGMAPTAVSDVLPDVNDPVTLATISRTSCFVKGRIYGAPV